MRGSSVGARSASVPFIINSAAIIIRVCAVWATLWELAGFSRKVDRHRPGVCGLPSRCKTLLRPGQRRYLRFMFVFYLPILRTSTLGVRTCPDISPSKIDSSKIRVLQNAPFLSNPARDRIAPDFTIRHLVWPIVALQRRMRFSARLAGFCKGRWHQRRARKADLASFSVFVSNLDFRVPRLRQREERAADRAVQRRKRGHPRGPEAGDTAA